jgi:hypothetical protein
MQRCNDVATIRKFDPLQGLRDQVAAVPQPHEPVNSEPVFAVATSRKDPALSASFQASPRPEANSGAQTPTPISQKVTAPSAPARPSRIAVRARKINVYIDPSEQEKISELDIFLRTQHGIRPSESHIMRAALVLLKSNSDFVDVIKTLREQDPRRNR